MNKEAINIKNNEGTAAASNKSSEAEIYAVVAKVSKLRMLTLRLEVKPKYPMYLLQ